MNYKPLLFIIVLYLLIVPVLALPNQDTDKSGNRCERAHHFNYNYNFNYNKSLEIGKSYDFGILFDIKDSTVTRNPYDVEIKIIPHNFKLSKDTLSLSNQNQVISIISLEKNPSLTIETTLILDGDTSAHGGFKATYKDVFELNNFFVSGSKTISQNTTPQITLTDNKKITKTTTVDSNKLNTNVNIQVNAPSKVPWYIVRITGIIAFILLSLSISLALLKKISPLKFRKLFLLHKDVSILAIIFSFMHFINLLWDKYEWSLGIKDIFWIDFSSKIKIMLSLGAIGFYGLLIMIIISISPRIIKLIKYKNWHFIHLFSYVLYLIVILHSIFLGFDLKISNIDNPLTLITIGIFSVLVLLNIFFSFFTIIIKLRGAKK